MAGGYPATAPVAPAAGFHRLPVLDVVRLCDDAVELAFAIPEHLRAEFAFEHGQHLAVRRVVDGEDLRRNYSITSVAHPNPAEVRIGVRRVDDGRVSSWLCDHVVPGDEVEVLTPHGRFTAPIIAGTARHWLLIGAGSGITPLMSLARTVLEREPDSRVTLLYGNRGVSTIMFHEQLEDLKSTHLQRLAVHHFLSRERRNLDLFDGRIDGDRVRKLAGLLFDPAGVDEAFVCGPEPMTADVRGVLIDLGMPAEHVHVELFGTPSTATAHAPAADDASVVATASVRINGLATEIDVREGERVLDAAQRAGLDVPYACKGGVCSTCRAHIDEGEVEMVTNYALDDSEVAAGYALTCQSVPRSDHLVVDFDRR